MTAIWEAFIFRQYKGIMRKKTFVQSITHHHIKKGDRRYTLMTAITSQGKIVYNLGRYQENIGKFKVIKYDLNI